MKKILLLLIMATFVQLGNAQFNVTYISDVSYTEQLSDIWGYVAPDGTEYSLVGVQNGLSIVSLADPANPLEVAFSPGANSIWRDIKTWDQYAYVTNESGGGLAVVDLSDLPNSISTTNFTDVGSLGVLGACHNIWMDENGYAYLCGCGPNNGGIIYLDCFTDPANPTLVGNGPAIYSHDVFTRNDKMYTSDIYDGVFRIYDVADKTNTIYEGEQQTDFTFTHNTWLTDDGNYLFTTDEVGDAPIGSYDVSDPTDIQLLDLFRPLATIGEGVLPHNVHVWEDWIIISYYSDGCIIVDGSNPSNLIEVGNFDTFLPTDQGFGVWGAYPFLPSGLILLSDAANGMFVLEPNYVRACWLEGKVTSSLTGAPINDANVEIVTPELNAEASNATGDYATGIATAGTYDVIYSATGYTSQTIPTVMENGVLNLQDVQLVPFGVFAATGQVVDAETGEAVPDASVELYSSDFTYNTTTDATGNFEMPAVLDGTYDAYAGKWGYQTSTIAQTVNGAPVSFTIEIDKGYRDEFAVDMGWTVNGNAATGAWERGEPIGTQNGNGVPFNPELDLSTDLGELCYVTGNGGGGVGNDDVDNGNTILTSPAMDLSMYETATLTFHAWFVNGGGNGTPNDELVVTINNGIATDTLEVINQNTNEWNGPYTYALADSIELTDNMTVSFETADGADTGHLVEAAIDLFEVTGVPFMVNTTEITDAFNLSASPNPFKQDIRIQYELPENIASAKLVVYNTLGQKLSQKTISSGSNIVIIDDILMKGLYFIQIEAGGFASKSLKVMKAE